MDQRNGESVTNTEGSMFLQPSHFGLSLSAPFLPVPMPQLFKV